MAESDASYKQSARRACNKSNGKWKWVLQKSRYNFSFLFRRDAKALSGIEKPVGYVTTCKLKFHVRTKCAQGRSKISAGSI